MESNLSIKELAEYLKIAEQTIRDWVQKQKIPFHTTNESIMFRVSEIEWWIENYAFLLCGTESMAKKNGFVPDVISLDDLREEEERAEMAAGDIEE